MTNNENSIKRRAWRPKEVAQMCGLSISQVRKDITAGNLKTARIGRAILITDDELNRYINGNSNNHGNDNSKD